MNTTMFLIVSVRAVILYSIFNETYCWIIILAAKAKADAAKAKEDELKKLIEEASKTKQQRQADQEKELAAAAAAAEQVAIAAVSFYRWMFCLHPILRCHFLISYFF